MKIIQHILIFFISLNSYGQNLLSNGSFEEYSLCPTDESQVDRAIGWTVFRESPDYFNSCSSNWNATAPTNITGYQNAFHGNAYMGMYASMFAYLTDGREYLGSQLNTTMSIGNTYFVQLRINLSNRSNHSINNFGLLLTTSVPTYQISTSGPVYNYAHLTSNGNVSDTANWVTISGTIVADSAYNYALIGNFFDDNNTTIVQVNNLGSTNDFAYYLVDDVCISEDPEYCNQVSSVNNISNNILEKHLVKIVDELGRETEYKPNVLLLYIYSDGTVEKVFRIE